MSLDIQFVQFEFQSGTIIPTHFHDEAQILFARSGTLELGIGSSLFLLPSSRLAWIPPRVDHSIRMRSQTFLRTAYISSSGHHKTPETTQIMQASDLFRATLLRLAEDDDLTRPFKSKLEDLLMMEITSLKSEAFNLKLPKDLRARKVARHIINEPGAKISFDALAQIAACSPKTLGRLFQTETGLTFKLWRRHARLLAGIEYLESGHSVTEAAYFSGYSTPSAFTEAFRLTFGYPPSRAQ